MQFSLNKLFGVVFFKFYYTINPFRRAFSRQGSSFIGQLKHYWLLHGLKRVYHGGEEGRTWDKKDKLSMGLMAMLSGPLIFIGMGVVMATGWVIFMCAVVGMSIEAKFTGPVMVTGCCRLTGDVMLTVLVAMFI